MQTRSPSIPRVYLWFTVWMALAIGCFAQAPESIGGATQDTMEVHRIAVRQSGALLPPGVLELETGFRYRRDKRTFHFGVDQTDRLAEAPISLRYGISPRIEFFAKAPLVWREITALVFDGMEWFEVSDQASGIGDVHFGFSGMLRAEGINMPEIVAQASVTAPTGSDAYGRDAIDGEVRPMVGTGTGHWVYEGGLSFVKMVDPLSIYWGVRAAHWSEERVRGLAMQPGLEFGYFLGVGFAVNRSISLSALFDGRYRRSVEWGGDRIPGSESESMLLRLGMTARVAPNLYLDPAVRIGLNADAPDAEVSVALIKRWF